MRVNLTLEEGLKDDLTIVANVTGRTIGELIDTSVSDMIERQDNKIKAVIEAARKARTN